MPEPVSIVWFRNDLRLDDNPALAAAVALGGPIIPAFIWAPEESGAWPPGGASRWWLHHSLTALAKDLQVLKSPLIVRFGPSLDALRALALETHATHLFWNRCYGPAFRERDSVIKKTLRDEGLTVQSYNGSLLFEPARITTQEGKPFQVFTAFWKACRNHAVDKPVAAPVDFLIRSKAKVDSMKVVDLELLPKRSWPKGLAANWKPGEQEAQRSWQAFKRQPIKSYQIDRDFPSVLGTSRLSPHLHFGEISPRRIWWNLNEHANESSLFYVRELGWREFAHHLLYHFPDTTHHPLRPRFGAFPWRRDKRELRAWQKGQTGYPLVDAGMRELWKTGWMHNRVRMVVGSFLVKHLLLPWPAGAAWFWDTLVDADLPNNTLGWQWCAGCGADAAPYFRIFNPVSQGEKFDPQGEYVRRWVPELAELPARWVHQPWQAPAEVLAAANVVLGSNYPRPIVDHTFARARALEAFGSIKGQP
jgi:deoxyribodipyrimidine photo-lyase